MCACVFCEKPGQESSECELVSGTPERKLILSIKNSYFNFTGPKHRALDCCSNKMCVHLNLRKNVKCSINYKW